MICTECKGSRTVYTHDGARPCPRCGRAGMNASQAFALFRLADVADRLRKGECGLYGLRVAYRQATATGVTLEDVTLILEDDELKALATGADSLF